MVPSAPPPPPAPPAPPAPAAGLTNPPSFGDDALMDGLSPVEPQYAHVMRIGLVATWAPLVIGAVAADQLAVRALDLAWLPVGLPTGLAVLAALLSVIILPARRYLRLGYAMTADHLRVARGYLFRTDTIVPFVRVQHIDVGQGPLERWFGLAHLTVHTSGTHNSMVTLPGLRRETAEAMREDIRRHIQSDFA